jgi:phytoene synthase
MAIDPQLEAAYDRCRRIQRRHDPTYYWATQRLPGDVRPAVHALYGFVRGADQIVDGRRGRPRDPDERRAALDAWEDELQAGIAAGRSAHPVIAALVDAGRRHDLPLEELGPYMRSMRLDCGPVRIATWAELERYMQGSAGSVGRIMAPLLGAPPDQHEVFGQLGLAFQLTNFIRDVREDYALDRVYLPAEDRERFGVAEADFARPHTSEGLRALVAFEVERARTLFRQTAPAAATTGARVRPAIRLARAAYLAVLDRVEAIGFDVLRRRTSPLPWQLGRAALTAARVER